jgi:hypothetical protein
MEEATERVEAMEEAEEATASVEEAVRPLFRGDLPREEMEVMEGLDLRAAAAVMLLAPPLRPALARTSGEGESSRWTVGTGCFVVG